MSSCSSCFLTVASGPVGSMPAPAPALRSSGSARMAASRASIDANSSMSGPASVGMRICGFGFDKQTDPPSSQTLADAWRPYMDTCIAAFGAKRAMFESNFPVDKGSYSYPVFWNAAKMLAKGASAEEKADLFFGTAKRFYRLDEIG